MVNQVLKSNICEEAVSDEAVDLILAIDDVISLGFRNIGSESMVLSALEMESSNEAMINLMNENRRKNAQKEQLKYLKD